MIDLWQYPLARSSRVIILLYRQMIGSIQEHIDWVDNTDVDKYATNGWELV